MSVTFRVTKECIRKGDRGGDLCPVVLAGYMAGVVTRVGFADKRRQKAEIFFLQKGRAFQLPEAVSQFVRDFDDGKPVNPFEFNLEI